MKITCSLLGCERPLLGTIIMLAPMYGEEIDWSKHFNQYNNMRTDGSILSYVLLHQTCFMGILEEFMKQELMTNLELIISPVALLAEEMGIPQ